MADTKVSALPAAGALAGTEVVLMVQGGADVKCTASSIAGLAPVGTVTSVSVTTANGVSGSVATATTTPAISLTLGAITPTTVNGNTISAGTGTLTLGASKTLTASDSTTLATNAITFGGGEVLTLTAANALTLTTTGSTNVTLPTSGTLAITTRATDAFGALTDITTNNVSASAHGFAPKLPNDATKYMDGTGAYTVPPGTGGFVTPTGTGFAHVTSGSLDVASKTVDLASADVTGVIPTVINAQTGTSYTFVAGDKGKLVTTSNASAIAVTLPQATGSFTTGWSVTIQNKGAGTVTITPTTSTIDGASSLTLTTNQGVFLASDGTNYSTFRGVSAAGTGDMVLASVQTVTGAKTFGSAGAVGKLLVAGNTSGATTLNTDAVAGSAVITIPAVTDTLVGKATTDTLTNKTLTSPVMTTPTLGVASATSVNKVAITAPATSSTLTVADGKTFTASNTVTLTGTDGVSMNVTNAKLAQITGIIDGGGSAIANGTSSICIPAVFAGTITAYTITVDTGTCTLKTWKKATGTAIPTVADSISTSGVAISSGTVIRSTTVSDFTSTTVTANDLFIFNVTAISSATKISFTLEITKTS